MTQHPGESSQLLRGPKPPRHSNTPPCTDKYTIPINASGQREVLTVVAHQTPVTESQCPTIGVIGQHEVRLHTCNPAKVESKSRSLNCPTTHKGKSDKLLGIRGDTGYLTTTSRH